MGKGTEITFDELPEKASFFSPVMHFPGAVKRLVRQAEEEERAAPSNPDR